MKLAAPLTIALVTLVLVGAAWDIHSRRIPNPVVLAGAAIGLALNTWLAGWPGAKGSLLGLLLGSALFLPPFLLQGRGGGDVKLMAAIGSFAGPLNTFVIFILIAVIGGIMAIALSWWKGVLWNVLKNVGFIVSELLHGRAPHERRPELSLDSDKSVKLPYAIPMAIGTLLFLAI